GAPENCASADCWPRRRGHRRGCGGSRRRPRLHRACPDHRRGHHPAPHHPAGGRRGLDQRVARPADGENRCSAGADMIERIVLAAILAAVLTLLFCRWGIPLLARSHVAQRIREEAPTQHRGKAGTPTMGGLLLILPGLGPVQLGWAYVIVAVLYVVGFTNAVNLTDGLDGLAAGTVAIASGAYAVVAVKTGWPEVAALAAAVAGACAGFVWFNAYPAAVFMGDTGSNALGAVLAGMAIVTQTEWLLLVIGLVFVLEAASV